jgi:hypothetical protein
MLDKARRIPTFQYFSEDTFMNLRSARARYMLSSAREERVIQERPMRPIATVVVAAMLALPPAATKAQTAEEWVAVGTRAHGGFGAFIPMGIRIGLDAVEKLKAGPRELTVSFYSGEKAPCPCIADGIMVATTASPGQGTLRVAEEKSPPGTLGVAVIAHRKTGQTLRYTIPGETGPKLVAINKTIQEPLERHHAVMKADGLFTVEETSAAR